MKKIFITFISLFIILYSTQSVNAFNQNIEVEYLSDGSYYTTIIEEIKTSQYQKATSTKKAEKVVKYVDSRGILRWKVSVIGTFRYNGTTVTCIKSEVKAQSYDNNWRIISQNASKTSNIAKATATAKNYYNGNVVATINKTVSLTCSKTGFLS